ncbi:MAG: replicative DNA helicase [Clostridiales bacterium]|nr:replicative DNA helicase [Clostridiales bacterium]
MTETIQTIPHDIDAEQAVIGAVICNPELYGTVSKLSESDFYDSRNRLIFRILPEYAKANNQDYVILKNIFERAGVNNSSNVMHYVFELISMVPSTDKGSVKSYMKIVKEKSERRRRIELLQKAVQDLYQPDKKVNEIDDKLINSVFGSETQNHRKMVPFDDAFSDLLDDIEKRKENKQPLAGYSSGFKRFNIMTGGLEKQKLYVIGGRPAMGKTALALNMASNLAVSGKTVAIFSLEMNRKEIAKRIISSVSGVKANKLKNANIDDSEYQDMGEAFNKIADKLIINDNAVQTVSGMVSDCIRWNTEHRAENRRIDVVIIDYLQLISNENKRLDRRIAIGESSRSCKIMAKRLDCPVILLSQLSRANESRSDKIPILSDLRESGDIEQDADVVAFVHREEYYNPTSENQGMAQISIAKNRDGEVGVFDLKWDKQTTTFSNMYGGYDFEP